MKTTKTYHMVIDVRGVLNWKAKEIARLFTDAETGKRLTAQQAKDYLYDKLKEGYEVIPFGKECEGFDKVKGCPGHPVSKLNKEHTLDQPFITGS